MAKPIYTEKDSIFKHTDAVRLVNDLVGIGAQDRKQGEELLRLLEKAKKQNSAVEAPSQELAAGWDEENEEYYVVLRDVYDPPNLISTLFERLVAVEEEDHELDKKNALALVEKYIGVIEDREKVSLVEAKEKLGDLVVKLKDTLHVFEEEDYPDEEFEKLSAALDAAYFDPISELLEGILVSIAGN